MSITEREPRGCNHRYFGRSECWCESEAPPPCAECGEPTGDGLSKIYCAKHEHLEFECSVPGCAGDALVWTPLCEEHAFNALSASFQIAVPDFLPGPSTVFDAILDCGGGAVAAERFGWVEWHASAVGQLYTDAGNAISAERVERAFAAATGLTKKEFGDLALRLLDQADMGVRDQQRVREMLGSRS